MRSLLIAFAILLAVPAGEAKGWSCPHGQIFRIHLRQCFDASSPMAHAFAWAPRTLRARGRLHIDVPAAVAPSPVPIPFPLPALDVINWGGPPTDDFTRGKLLLRGMMLSQQGAAK